MLIKAVVQADLLRMLTNGNGSIDQLGLTVTVTDILGAQGSFPKSEK